jgi:hypothetical protein
VYEALTCPPQPFRGVLVIRPHTEISVADKCLLVYEAYVTTSVATSVPYY